MKINDQFAINVLMRRNAILAVKAQLKAHGVRSYLWCCADIMSLRGNTLKRIKRNCLRKPKNSGGRSMSLEQELAWLLTQPYGARRTEVG